MADTTRSARLSLIDGIALTVGIIIGTGIFEATPDIVKNVSGTASLLGIWLLGGLLSLFGAWCYAELSCLLPEDGGDFVYLRHAFGPLPAFLFAWSNVLIIVPGSIAAMAYPFATYFMVVVPAASKLGTPLIAATSVLLVTAVNAAGFHSGVTLQKLLTVTKITLFVAMALVLFAFAEESHVPGIIETGASSPGISLILILFCYGGWQEICYVAGEVENPTRNLPRIIVGSLIIVTGLMLLITLSFLYVLGFNGIAFSSAVATDAVSGVFDSNAGKVVAVLIALSALGVINGMIFMGARVGFALGQKHPAARYLALWDEAKCIPPIALWFQALISLFFILVAGSFTDVLVYTTPVVWTFFLLTALAVILLRKSKREPRTFSVPYYPVPVIIFCLSCLYLIYSSIIYDPVGTAISTAFCLTGIPVYFYEKKKYFRVDGKN